MAALIPIFVGSSQRDAVELEPIPGQPTKRAFQASVNAYDRGILIRTTGNIIAVAPPLIISNTEIHQLIGTLGNVLGELG